MEGFTIVKDVKNSERCCRVIRECERMTDVLCRTLLVVVGCWAKLRHERDSG